MKNLPFYKEVLNCSSEAEVFAYLIATLKPKIAKWDYFVNWETVFDNSKKDELLINQLSSIIGKENFNEEFRQLMRVNPKIASVIPSLVVRDGSKTKNFNILVSEPDQKLAFENFDFATETIDENDIEKYLKFVKKTGLINLFIGNNIQNLRDYMIGVEAGLNSNARKNRIRDMMETIVEEHIKQACKEHNSSYLQQANSKMIMREFGIDVPVEISSRRYDFVIKTEKELFLIEVNYYSGDGSKLKATAGEYRDLFEKLDGKFKFLWITDGQGWKKAKDPLRDTFNRNDYIFNLKMLEEGILDFLLKN